MTLDRDIVKLARRIQHESSEVIPFQQARLTAARELGGLSVHTMAPGERIPLRVQYTGESEAAAESAISSDTHGLGLDHCSDDQRAFRALLALALFNGNVYTGPTARWNYSVVASYDPVMSPRRDQLVIVAERAPENVATRLLATQGAGSRGVPGLRHEVTYTCHGQRSVCLRHLPTGALLTITGDPAGCRRGNRRSLVPRHPYLTLDNDLTAHERRALAAIPPISGEATTLLAGLVSRYNLVDRCGRWATSLSWDPLERPGVERRKEPEVIRHGPVRRLWGAGDSWECRWTGYPEPRDLALALTHREAGVKGARFTRHGDTYRVVLGTASLDLCDGKG
ncbi:MULTISPECIES: hypothetical protein [unclassified Streptomyces]|uniref:hypothetical protein n=1 Tax=unclassified Streptomyces TaxID=2593676 RepID=UPI000881D253|nr:MULTISPECIES: hypothetical protein [unclassified Streptomyces]PBC84298.1 hypothetical protein BX261_4281 [Streptomyces sp. 2321.6]SDR32663.1 hypothetical protein SAMN05216511_2918 [Streptomyces sp. KS_16]SED26478.1 hypothetical protein SAMN05428940_4308 [Streptomyces sp. 2133.1]SNC70380.1 hypothetical protein SAMN06272741_4272 [Streptomyces sp. 2114.4]